MIRLINNDFRNVYDELKAEYKDRNIIVISDPPFNVGYHYGEYKDNLSDKEYLSLMRHAFDGFPCVIIHYPEDLYKIAFAMNHVPQRVVSWVYNSNTKRQHRDIAFFDVTPDFSLIKQPYKNPNDKRIAERIENGWWGADLYDWWQVEQVKNVSAEKTEHPCQMPIEVMRRIVGILPKDALIIDPFMGSGTTGIACKIWQRDFIGIELDKKYYEIAEKRIAKYGVQLSLFD